MSACTRTLLEIATSEPSVDRRDPTRRRWALRDTGLHFGIPRGRCRAVPRDV